MSKAQRENHRLYRRWRKTPRGLATVLYRLRGWSITSWTKENNADNLTLVPPWRWREMKREEKRVKKLFRVEMNFKGN